MEIRSCHGQGQQLFVLLTTDVHGGCLQVDKVVHDVIHQAGLVNSSPELQVFQVLLLCHG